MVDPTVVRGPLAPSPGSGVIYQVTLSNGHIVTRPEAVISLYGWRSIVIGGALVTVGSVLATIAAAT